MLVLKSEDMPFAQSQFSNAGSVVYETQPIFKTKIKHDDVLSSLVFYRTYAKTLDSGFKETPDETVNRVAQMHIERYPALEKDILWAFDFVRNKKVVPSMRSKQFAGEPIKRSHSRVYNCAYSAITGFKDFSDIFFKLMNGCGVGYSVQKRHVMQLPPISALDNQYFMEIQDSKESWADSMFALLLTPHIVFDYSRIRPRGARLSTGGTASGPEPLQKVHESVRKILLKAAGRQLTPLEVHSIVTLVSDCVVVGGVRRAALICLFDVDDHEMLSCKDGEWWKENPHFARANNSAVIHRRDPNFAANIKLVMNHCFNGQSGEPGVFLTDDYDYGCNPCSEISLRDGQLCNLSEVNAAACTTVEEFKDAIRAATIIGTLQATFTEFKYVQPKWRLNCEEEALLGVSITGQAEKWDMLSDASLLRDCAQLAKDTNTDWAKKLGINPASRIGCVKPSGTTSAYLNTTSGIHSAHSEYYLRRVRVDLMDPIADYLIRLFGLNEPNTGNIVENDLEKPYHNIVVTIPINKKGSITRSSETSLDLLNRAKHIFDNWVVPSHRSGPNYHNVSLTVSYKEHEKEQILSWMLENRDSYAGIAFLPFSDANYQQAPFQEITKEEYNSWVEKFGDTVVDFSALDFSNTEDKRGEEAACSGGLCEVK